MTEIHGHCHDDFAIVRDAFAANFAAGEEIGACAAVTLNGEMVVDIWAGDRNSSGDPWVADTIVNVYSTTKTMASICMLMLADRGQLRFDLPVAEYWPEFARNGKGAVLVSHVMSHQAGLPGFEPPVSPEDLYDHAAMAALLEAMTPWWTPGEGIGYHAITQGFVQAEILRRIDGRTMGQFFREEVAEPLGADFHIGLPAAEDHRVADLDPPVAAMDAVPDMGTTQTRTFRSAPLSALEPRSRDWRGAEIPAAGGTGNARSVARVHSAIACGGEVDGVRLMSPEATLVPLMEQCIGDDQVLDLPARFGMGFGLNHPLEPSTPSDESYFWGGWGGSTSIIDVGHQMSIAYVMNNMADALTGDERGRNITRAAYAALGVS